MAENETTTETKPESAPAAEATTETYESPSLGDLLKSSRDKGHPVSDTDITANAHNSVIEKSQTEEKAEPVAEVTLTPEVKVEPAQAAPAAALDPWENEKRGLLGAISNLRSELRQLKQESGTVDPAPAGIESDVPPRDPAIEALSLHYAKQLHSDFDDVYKAFESEVQSRAAQGDYSLYHQARQAQLPYEAAYTIGKQLLVAKKYGPEAISNPDALRAALEKEVRDEAYAKGFAAAEAKLQGVQREREKQPTNIGSGKAVQGTTEADYRSPSFGELLSQVHKRSRANGYDRNYDGR